MSNDEMASAATVLTIEAVRAVVDAALAPVCERLDALENLLGDTYKRADVDIKIGGIEERQADHAARVGELEAKLARYAEQATEFGADMRTKLTNVTTTLEASVNTTNTRLAQVMVLLEQGAQLAKQAAELTKQNADRINQWSAIHTTTQSQVAGQQQELDSTQARTARLEERSADLVTKEADNRNAITNHEVAIVQLRQQQSDWAPVLKRMDEYLQRQQRRRENLIKLFSPIIERISARGIGLLVVGSLGLGGIGALAHAAGISLDALVDLFEFWF